MRFTNFCSDCPYIGKPKCIRLLEEDACPFCDTTLERWRLKWGSERMNYKEEDLRLEEMVQDLRKK